MTRMNWTIARTAASITKTTHDDRTIVATEPREVVRTAGAMDRCSRATSSSSAAGLRVCRWPGRGLAAAGLWRFALGSKTIAGMVVKYQHPAAS
jgi:hypothetical protein